MQPSADEVKLVWGIRLLLAKRKAEYPHMLEQFRLDLGKVGHNLVVIFDRLAELQMHSQDKVKLSQGVCQALQFNSGCCCVSRRCHGAKTVQAGRDVDHV